MPAVESSVIRHVAYDAAERFLEVTFTSGRRYVYGDVPAAIYRAFLEAESKGTYFNAEIRDCFSVAEITARPGRAR